MNHPHRMLIFAGLVPLVAVHIAWWINLPWVEPPGCNPYLEGCTSVSRAVRVGPGLHVFRALVLPTAAVLALSWLAIRAWLIALDPRWTRRASVIGTVGFIGALFLVMYATWLGTEGEFYRWLRRQGVIFFFGLTGIAQLLVAWVLFPERQRLLGGRLQGPINGYMVVIALQWVIGIASAFIGLLVTDPDAKDAAENILEWGFLITLCSATALAGVVMARSGFSLRAGLDSGG